MTMQENTKSKWSIGEFSDAYKGYHDFRPNQRECEHFMSLSEEDKDKEMESYGVTICTIEEMEAAMGHTELWSACNLIRDKIESNLDLVTDDLVAAILRAKACKEEAEQAWMDTRL